MSDFMPDKSNQVIIRLNLGKQDDLLHKGKTNTRSKGVRKHELV